MFRGLFWLDNKQMHNKNQKISSALGIDTAKSQEAKMFLQNMDIVAFFCWRHQNQVQALRFINASGFCILDL
jgi:hypothetical protein